MAHVTSGFWSLLMFGWATSRKGGENQFDSEFCDVPPLVPLPPLKDFSRDSRDLDLVEEIL